MSSHSRKVYCDTRTVGSYFGTVGVLRTLGRHNRIVATCDTVRPFGFTSAAIDDARTLAARRGYTIVEDAS